MEQEIRMNRYWTKLIGHELSNSNTIEESIDKDEITAEVRFFNIGETELCEYDFESSEEYFAAMERGEEGELKEMDKYLAEQGGLPTVMWG